MSHSEIVSFLWGVADLIRDTFKRGKYQDIILPLTVLRRLDCVLAPTKEKVLRRQAELRDRKLENPGAQLRKVSGFAFYNTSRYDFDKLLADAPHLAANLRNYIASFSQNMREVLEKFDFDNTISKLDEAGLLFQVLERFKNVDLHPDEIDNPTMGTIFEELIRKFNEALKENPVEHFTPRDVVHLMVDLMLAGGEARIRSKGVVRTVYDPCCGSGGMLTITKEHITVGLRRNGNIIRQPINPGAEIHLFGQEVNPETWAVSKSDLFMKDPTGRDADNIAFGTTLSNDRHSGSTFDYLIANPPYGKDWKRDEDAVRAEHEQGPAGRFAAGLPRISDGQLLFLLQMLAHAKDPKEGGSRIAIINEQEIQTRCQHVDNSGAAPYPGGAMGDSPLDGVVVDADDREVPAGEVGELLARGPYTIRGYYRADAHNRTAFTAGGFDRTGDRGRAAARRGQEIAMKKKVAKRTAARSSKDLTARKTRTVRGGEAQVFTSVSNVLKTRHDTVKNSIGNIR